MNKTRVKQKELTLEQKIALIKDSANSSQRTLGQCYGVSKTTMCNILKRKREYLDAYESNVGQDRKRLCNAEGQFDRAVLEWFKQKTAKLIPVSGPLLQEKAQEIAA